MLKSYEATLDHGHIEWQGERPEVLKARIIVTILEERGAIRHRRQASAALAAQVRTLGNSVQPLVDDAVEHQQKMDRYDRLMSDLRGKVRIGRKLTRDELNER
jgi:hypothetical protein